MPDSNESATQVLARRRAAKEALFGARPTNADECDPPHDAPTVAWIVVNE